MITLLFTLNIQFASPNTQLQPIIADVNPWKALSKVHTNVGSLLFVATFHLTHWYYLESTDFQTRIQHKDRISPLSIFHLRSLHSLLPARETMAGVETYKLGDWKLQSGQSIPDAHIAYKTFGDPKSPAIIYPTWYSGCMYTNLSLKSVLS